jgi:hypothetical protein
MTRSQDENPPPRSLLDQFSTRPVLESGEELAVAKGAEQALRAVLTDQLRSRFGTLPEDAAARIATASATDLRRWCLRV